MKRLKTIVAILLIACMSITITGCFGKFALTKKVYDFNNSMGNKFVKEAVFLAFVIIPVYGVTTFIDAIFLNTVEFWTGSNPMALKEGVNKVKVNGQDVTIILENNKAIIYDKDMKELARLNYNENTKTWYSYINGHTNKLMTIGDEKVTLYSATGKSIEVEKSKLHDKNTITHLQELTAMK